MTASVHFTGVKQALRGEGEGLNVCVCSCVWVCVHAQNAASFDYKCKFWCMWHFTHLPGKSGGQRGERKRNKKTCTYTCQVTLEQMVKSKYSTTGTEGSRLTLWVCESHACVLLCICVNVRVYEVSDELRGGARPAAQRQTAGSRFELWGPAPADACICPCTVSSRPYCMYEPWGQMQSYDLHSAL